MGPQKRDRVPLPNQKFELTTPKTVFSFSQNGESALHAASLFGHLGIVKLLLHAGADPALRNQDGATPLDLATSGRHSHVVEYLRLH